MRVEHLCPWVRVTGLSTCAPMQPMRPGLGLQGYRRGLQGYRVRVTGLLQGYRITGLQGYRFEHLCAHAAHAPRVRVTGLQGYRVTGSGLQGYRVTGLSTCAPMQPPTDIVKTS